MVNTRSKTLLSKRGLAERAVNAARCAAGYVFNSVKGLCTRRAPKTRGSKRSGASNKTPNPIAPSTHARPSRGYWVTDWEGVQKWYDPDVEESNYSHVAHSGNAGGGRSRTRKTRGRKH